MILYTNGDSFVAGNSLAMPDFQGFPGFLPLGAWEDPDWPETVRSWYFKSLVKNNLTSDDVEPIERSRAFARKISQKLNIPLVDNSKGGSSFHRIARTSLADLLKLKQENPDDSIVAIIGITSPNRSEVAYVYPHSKNPSWIEVHFGSRGVNPKDVDSIMYYKLKYESMYHKMMSMLQNIILLKGFCLSNDIKLYFTGSEWSEVDQVPYENYPDLKLLRDYVGNLYDVNMKDIAETVDRAMLPDGHFKEEVHDLVAEKFVEMIKKL